MTLAKISYLVSGMAGILVLGTIAGIVVSTIQPQFSWEEQALSELGGAFETSHVLFNSSLVIAGILIVIFSLALFRVRASHLIRAGAILLVIAAGFIIFIGLLPFDVYGTWHDLVSIGYFLSSPSASLVIAMGLFRRRKYALAMTAGMAGITIFLSHLSILVIREFLNLQLSVGIGIAIPEFTGALSAAIWIAVIGTEMIKSRESFLRI